MPVNTVLFSLSIGYECLPKTPVPENITIMLFYSQQIYITLLNINLSLIQGLIDFTIVLYFQGFVKLVSLLYI